MTEIERTPPVNRGLLDQIQVVGSHRRLHHLVDEVFGQVGQRSSQLLGSVGLELSLASEKLGNVDVGESGLRRYLTVRFAGISFHGL